MEQEPTTPDSYQTNIYDTKNTLKENGGLKDLSPREKEVLKFSADGLNNKQISEKMKLSVDTIDTHCRNIGKSLTAKNMKQAIAIGIREKIID